MLILKRAMLLNWQSNKRKWCQVTNNSFEEETVTDSIKSYTKERLGIPKEECLSKKKVSGYQYYKLNENPGEIKLSC